MIQVSGCIILWTLSISTEQTCPFEQMYSVLSIPVTSIPEGLIRIQAIINANNILKVQIILRQDTFFSCYAFGPAKNMFVTIYFSVKGTIFKWNAPKKSFTKWMVKVIFYFFISRYTKLLPFSTSVPLALIHHRPIDIGPVFYLFLLLQHVVLSFWWDFLHCKPFFLFTAIQLIFYFIL